MSSVNFGSQRRSVNRRGGARLHGAGGERHVGGHHDRALGGALRDVIVGRIHAGGYDDPFDQRAASRSGARFCVRPPANKIFARYRDRAVAHHHDLDAMALSHAIDLLLHRTGIGVDEDGDGVVRGAHSLRAEITVAVTTVILART